MHRVADLTLLEVIVVLAIVIVASAYAFGVLRRTPQNDSLDLTGQIALRVAMERARSVQTGSEQKRSFQELLFRV